MRFRLQVVRIRHVDTWQVLKLWTTIKILCGESSHGCPGGGQINLCTYAEYVCVTWRIFRVRLTEVQTNFLRTSSSCCCPCNLSHWRQPECDLCDERYLFLLMIEFLAPCHHHSCWLFPFSLTVQFVHCEFILTWMGLLAKYLQISAYEAMLTFVAIQCTLLVAREHYMWNSKPAIGILRDSAPLELRWPTRVDESQHKTKKHKQVVVIWP